MSSFGLLVPGRPVETGFQQVESNKFLITIPNAGALNHIVVFMTGVVQLPPDTGACIYFSLPDPNAPPTWHYLGYLSNEKPSAIYKLTNLTQSSCRSGDSANTTSIIQPGGLAFNYTQAPVTHVAQVGISVDPIGAVVQMVPATETSASNVNSFTEFINKTVSNLYNYCSSFSRPAQELMGNPFQSNHPSNSTQYVPLSTIQTWFQNYTRRLANDSNFWRTLN